MNTKLRLTIEKLGLPQLLEVRDEIEALIEKRKGELKEATRQAVLDQVASAGFKMEDLFGPSDATKNDRRRRSPEPKYRNPKNSSETWSGRGRMPRWMTALIGNAKDVAAAKAKYLITK